MADERTTRILLQLVSDQKTFKATKKDIEDVTRLLGETSKQQMSLAQTSRALNIELAHIARQSGIDRITADFREAVKGGAAAELALKRVREQLQAIGATSGEIKKVTRELAGVESGGAGGKGRSGLSRVGSEIKALPAVPLGGGISTDVLGKVLNTLGQLGPVGQGAAIGLVAVIGALKAATGQYEATTKAIIASQKEYYTLLLTGTREQVQGAVQAKRQEIEILRAHVSENQRILGQFQQEAGGVGRAIADALDLGGVQALRVQTQDLEQQLKNAELALKRQAFALNSTEVATNTLVEAERKLAEQRTQSALQLASAAAKQTLFELQSAQNIQTTDQLKDALVARFNERQAIEAEIEALKASGETSDDVSRRLAELMGRLNELGRESSFLFSDVAPLVKMREQMEAARKSSEELASSLDRVRDAQRKFQDIQQAYNDKLADIAANLNKALSNKLEAIDEAIAEAQDKRSELIAKSQDQLNEEERKAFLDREKLAREHEKRIQKILRDGARDQQRAIEDRDAVALDRAQQAQSDALRDEQEAYDERTREIDQRLQEQNRLVSKRLVEQLREVDKRLAEQIQAAIRRYNEQVLIANQQTAAAKAAYNKQLSDLKYALSQDANIRNSAYNTMLNSASSFRTGLQAIASSIINMKAALDRAASGTRSSGGGGPKLPTPYASGGSIRAGTLAQVNEPGSTRREAFVAGGRAQMLPGMGLFIPQRNGYIDPGRSSSGRSLVVNHLEINANGLNEQQAARVIRRELREFTEGFGS